MSSVCNVPFRDQRWTPPVIYPQQQPRTISLKIVYLQNIDVLTRTSLFFKHFAKRIRICYKSRGGHLTYFNKIVSTHEFRLFYCLPIILAKRSVIWKNRVLFKIPRFDFLFRTLHVMYLKDNQWNIIRYYSTYNWNKFDYEKQKFHFPHEDLKASKFLIEVKKSFTP